MGRDSRADSPLVDVDAGTAFLHPIRVVLALTFVAGLLDAVGFSEFGVFTANQAGNLVIGWTLIPDDPASALLSFASILGCGLGVAAVAVLRSKVPWFSRGPGSRTLLLLAGALILVAGVVGSALSSGSASAPDLWTSHWWGAASSVAMTAASVATLAMVFVSGGGMRAPILASTNAYVDAVRYGTASVLVRDRHDWVVRARRAAGFPLAWTLGAACATLLPFGSLAAVGCAVLVIAGVAVLSRRVTEPADGTRRTV